MVKNKKTYEAGIIYDPPLDVGNYDNVNSPAHYKYGKKETIEVIRDCMTDDEYHGYLKGNVLKYVSRYKFKGEPLEDLQKAQWYLNRLIKEVNNGTS